MGPANWFDTQSTAAIGGNADHNGNPSELNFAFAGSLSVDGVSYPVVIGQGSNAQGNNWWIGGQGWTAGADGVIVSPDGKISLAIDYNGSGSPTPTCSSSTPTAERGGGSVGQPTERPAMARGADLKDSERSSFWSL